MNIKDIFTVIKRELKGFFSDKTFIVQIILFPFAIIVGYSFLMVVMSDESNDTDTSAYFVNAPEYMVEGFTGMNIEQLDVSDVEAMKSKIMKKEAQLLIVFPKDFVLNQENLCNIDIWYNSADTSSARLFGNVNIYLNAFQPQAFTVNMSEDMNYDLSNEKQKALSLFGGMLPSMIIMVVFIMIMNSSAEAIAGDKERGFLNTMLVTPVSRTSIAAGKAISIYILAIIGGLSTFGGIIISLPKMAKAIGLSDNMPYSASNYALLFAITMITVFAAVSLLLIVSTLANGVKQATAGATLMTFLFMVPSFLLSTEGFEKTILKLGARNNLIPIWNTLLNIRNVVMLDYSSYDILISIVVNIIFCIIATAFVAHCFKNEKIVNG